MVGLPFPEKKQGEWICRGGGDGRVDSSRKVAGKGLGVEECGEIYYKIEIKESGCIEFL